ncbi:MAG: DNA-binding transcriptional MerR regulator [Verrucomicrobiales bacterium]|jgi:DNA-binding transcriptional MerR regulator
MPSIADSEPPYDISVVARLTGLSAANLRMWEKRYEVVAPERSESGRRLYSDEDVHRLTLLKSLSDRGKAIRKTCALSIDELEQLLLETISKGSPKRDDNVSRKPGCGCRLVVVGEHLCETLRAVESPLKGTTTIAEFPDLDAAEAKAASAQADLLLIECPALFADTVGRVQQLIDKTNAVRAILIYFYSQSQTVRALEDGLDRITAIRAPISPNELQVACAADIALANRSTRKALEHAPQLRSVGDEIPERQFTDLQLAKISQISTAIECECPHHLASLLSSLIGFERYSAECENRNEADAEMHAYLHKMTAHARATMEDALRVLVELEGIDLDG